MKSYASDLLMSFINSKKKVYLYGLTPDSKYIIKNFTRRVDGIIDQKKFNFEKFNNIKFVDLSLVTANSIIINCCSGMHTNEVELMLKEKSDFVINFFDFISLFLPNTAFDTTDCPILKDWKNFPKVLQQNVDLFDKFKILLEDEISKKHFNDYLNARLLGDISIIGQQKLFEDQATMYFQKFIPNITDYKFLDIGGFDGANSLAFLSMFQDSHAICIEPNKKNLEKIRAQLHNYSDRIILLHNAVGKNNKIVRISQEGAKSKVEEPSHQSNDLIIQKNLDTIFDELALWKQKIFVKIDVEGSELEVLQGAAKVLKEKNIIFAISCYHKSDDLVNFYGPLKNLLHTRKVYFRHLTTGAYETVLFII